MKNLNNPFPINVTGQIYDNRIDCARLSIKNKWEIVVTRTIPLDLISDKNIQKISYLTLKTVGNEGPPYFISEIKDVYIDLIPGVSEYIFKLP